MREGGVFLIGFEDQENLGLRYLAACLGERGIRVRIEPFQGGRREQLFSAVVSENPKIVGFSMIFQRMLYDFRDLIFYLRDRGVACHFTMGGHFPSLEPVRTLELMPGLDSVVRFEGEETLFELYEKIDDPGSWKGIKGLVFRSAGDVHVCESRPLIEDLDTLPFPVRSGEADRHRDLGICSILGSRGCYHNCSFCSIRQFYGTPPGALRRTRSPSNIIGEMEGQFFERGVRIFIFQDDEWFMKGARHIQWVEAFVRELKKSRIADEILWRISCRVDDVREGLIARMKDAGLMCVYLGIESGNERGLKTFNKHYSVEDIHRAVGVLNGVGMPFEFGFMIFDPESTLESIQESILLLERITEGGKAVAHFSKMVPYAGTAIAEKLEKAGRLGGTSASPDYGYGDGRMNLLQYFASEAFNFRNFSPEGLVERLRIAKFDGMAVRKFFSDVLDAEDYERRIKDLIIRSNDSVLETLSLAVEFMKNRTEKDIIQEWNLMELVASEGKNREKQISLSLDALEAEFDHRRVSREREMTWRMSRFILR